MQFPSGVAMIAAALLAQGAAAQGFFLPADDLRLREDVTLLADLGLVNLPVNGWPLARRDVAEAMAEISEERLEDPALLAVLRRVQAATTEPADTAAWKIREVGLSAGQPGLLRDYGTPGRENGELTTTGGATTDRYSITLSATGALDPADGQHLRFDGSDISIRWGNWLISLNEQQRWWGPGYEGSLILSTNARPMPALALTRLRSKPFDVPVLRWLGPWNFTTFFGLGEQHRADVDEPLFMGMRVAFKPVPWFEGAMSRTAMFCGEGRECNFGTIGRMLIGKDNPGYRGASTDPAKEPGNQMAGFEVRIVSPFKPLPIAVYGQQIGEDNSDTAIPERYLALYGGEMWFMLSGGSVLRMHLEYANTKVKWYNREAEFNTAYRHGIYFAGYRYRGRNIGHATDADSETVSIGMSLTSRNGNRMAVQYRHGALDRAGGVDPHNTLTAGRSTYEAMKLDWDGEVGAGRLVLQLGYESQSPHSAGDANGMFGFIQWRRQLR